MTGSLAGSKAEQNSETLSLSAEICHLARSWGPATPPSENSSVTQLGAGDIHHRRQDGSEETLKIMAFLQITILHFYILTSDFLKQTSLSELVPATETRTCPSLYHPRIKPRWSDSQSRGGRTSSLEPGHSPAGETDPVAEDNPDSPASS